MTAFAEQTPQLGFPYYEMFRAGEQVVGVTIAYDDTNPKIQFGLPVNTLVVALGVEPTTAWGDRATVEITDTSGNNLMRVGNLHLGDTSTVCWQMIGRTFTSQADLRVITREGTSGAPSAGAANVWLVYRGNSNVLAPLAGKV